MPSSLPKKATGAPKSKAESSNAPALQRIAALEAQLLADTFDPNGLVPLLELAVAQSPEVVHKAVWALHRVFVAYVQDGRVSRLVQSGGDRGAEGDEAALWVGQRLGEYVEVLGGLMRDSEEGLRAAALPLLMALLPPLSAAVSSPTSSIHTDFFRAVLRFLLDPQPSLRGSKPAPAPGMERGAVPSNQVDLAPGVLPDDVVQLAHAQFWAPYDDLRWVFFREAARYLQTQQLAHPANLLAQLLPLTNLPTKADHINAFWVTALATPPSAGAAPKKTKGIKKKEKKAKGDKQKKKAELDALPSWMTTYEEDSSDADEIDNAGPVAISAGGKRKRTNVLGVHQAVHSVPSHTAVYSALWEAVLARLTLDTYWTRRILVALHGSKGILAHMGTERRIRVADWLGGLVDRGGSEGMLAMNGLFVLMTQYNLDYPNFYHRLYAMLDANVLHVKYRARFFRLLDTFLSSALLPASLIASFIKRLSRLTLTAPPAGIILVVPFIYNLFKRHKGCMVMLQRHALDPTGPASDASPLALGAGGGAGAGSNATGGPTDPYDPLEPAPMQTKAIDSSCWELAALQKHYSSSVSTLAKVFGEAFTRPEYNMEDFLDHGYTTLFDTEMKRKLRNAPALSLALELGEGKPAQLFPSTQTKRAESVASLMGSQDIVSTLWSF